MAAGAIRPSQKLHQTRLRDERSSVVTREDFFTLVQSGDFGTVDTAVAFVLAVAPSGDASQFYSGLNDSGVTITSTADSFFKLSGFDAGFIVPSRRSRASREDASS
jgi:hypothetical protein